MKDPVVTTIDVQLKKLYQQVISLNQQGNLHGLFSCFVLYDVLEFPLEWNVLCTEKEWLKNVFQDTNVYHIAALGYSLKLNPRKNGSIRNIFSRALNQLMGRKLFNGSHTTFPYNPLVFLGLSLGVKSLSPKDGQRYVDWLLSVLRERKKKGKMPLLHELYYHFIEALLTNQVIAISADKYKSLEELSLLALGYKKGFFKFNNHNIHIVNIRNDILNILIRSDIDNISPENAALIWQSTNDSVFGGIDRLIDSPNHLCVLLNKFQAAMKRWRYDSESLKKTIRWPIQSEREVQDIIWLMLRPYFDDIIDEENLPKFGHSSYKPDFAFPSLSVLLEVKYTRSAVDFKRIEKEIMEDSVGYMANTSEYNKIIVFIYDNSCSVQEHDETRRALMQIDSIEYVIIVSRPSQLPA